MLFCLSPRCEGRHSEEERPRSGCSRPSKRKATPESVVDLEAQRREVLLLALAAQLPAPVAQPVEPGEVLQVEVAVLQDLSRESGV